MATTATLFHDYLREKIRAVPEKKKTLEEILVLEAAEMERKLVTSGFIDGAKLLQLKSDFFHIPLASLDQLEVSKDVSDLIPASTLRTYRIVPFAKSGRTVKVAISDPTNLQILEALQFLAKKNNWNIELYLVTEDDMNTLLRKSVGTAGEVKAALKEFTRVQTIRTKVKGKELDEGFEEKAPVSKIIDGIITQALSLNASDIHIESLEGQSRVRFRVDGVLQEAFSFPLNAHSSLVSSIKILANLNIDEQRLPQDGRFRFSFNNEDVDFRVSTFPTNYGEKVVLRALSRAQNIPTLDEL